MIIAGVGNWTGDPPSCVITTLTSPCTKGAQLTSLRKEGEGTGVGIDLIASTILSVDWVCNFSIEEIRFVWRAALERALFR